MSQKRVPATQRVGYFATLLTAHTASPFSSVIEQIEAAVPIASDLIDALIDRQASWDDVRRETGRDATYGFIMYFRNQVDRIMLSPGIPVALFRTCWATTSSPR
jgi:hypothetical protein